MGRIRNFAIADQKDATNVPLPKTLSLARVVLIRFDGVFHLQSLSGELLISQLPNDDINRAFIKKGCFVAYEVANRNTQPVRVAIHHVLYPKQIQALKDAGEWPAQSLSESDDQSDVDTEDISSSDSEDGTQSRTRGGSQSARKKRSSSRSESRPKADDPSEKLIGQISDFLGRIIQKDEGKVDDGAAQDGAEEFEQGALDDWAEDEQIPDVDEDEQEEQEEDEDEEEDEEGQEEDGDEQDEECMDENEMLEEYD